MNDNSDAKKSFGNKVSDSFKEGTKPKFLGGKSEGGDTPSGLKAKDKNASAASDLKSAESGATAQNLSQSEDTVAGTRKTEEQVGGFYSGSGRGESGRDKGEGKKGPKGKFLKGGPITLIFLVIFGAGGLMGATQAFQPFSLLAQFTESFNSMHTSTNMRANQFYRMQMGKRNVKRPIKSKIFSPDTFKISESQAQKLSAQGIEYDDDFEGSGIRVLKFDDGESTRVVVADEASLDAIYKTGAFKDGGEYGSSAVTFKNLYNENIDFFNRYNAGSMTWRGAIANWFGRVTGLYHTNNNLSRNRFQDFQNEVNKNDGDADAAMKKILSKGTEEVSDGGVQTMERKEDGVDEEGNTKYRSDEVREGGVVGKTKYGIADIKNDAKVKEALDQIVKKYNGDSNPGGVVQKVVNYSCLAINILGGVGLLVSAAQGLQILSLATGYFEVIDKTKAGYGDEAPLNEMTNALNERKTTTHEQLVGNGNSVVSITEQTEVNPNIADGKVNTLTNKSTTTTKSAMEASGISALYGAGAVNPNDPSVQSFNFTKNIKSVLGGIGTSMAAFTGCAIAKVAANAVSAGADIATTAACASGVLAAGFTLGASLLACLPELIKVVGNAAISASISVLIAGIVATITPIVANMLTRDLITNLGGEDLGNALTSGANMYQGNAHRYNGGSLATSKKYSEFAMAQKQVIAENAKFERSTLSPFDLTSKNTFLGTMLTQMMKFSTANSLTGVVKVGSSAVSSSLVSMLPSAMAYDISAVLPTEEEYLETCPYLASIGAIGDAYCNPYSVTDITTIDYDPSDVISKLSDEGNFINTDNADNENVIIDAKSGLARYILFCDNRESAFGIADQNINNQTMSFGDVRTSNQAFNNVANGAIGAIPVVGDVIDVVQNSQSLSNAGYISGESCVAGNQVDTNVLSSSPGWETSKYYQRFIEDQSLAESMGLIKESAVSAFLDEYYKENPLDNSYEGILARRSGLTKDSVVALLKIIEYGQFIANYDPTTRYAFGAPAFTPENEIKFNNEYQLASEPILLNPIMYADIRNRSFAV